MMRRLVILLLVSSLWSLGLGTSSVCAQLRIDFTRAPDDEPLQAEWEPFQGDGIDPITEIFDLNGKSIDITVEGNTHWRDYRPATGGFAEWSDLLRDGPLCNDFCEMTLTLENLDDGDYDLRTYFHTTQFGEQDGRPFTPFSIFLTDGQVTNQTVTDNAIMSDDSSDDLSTETISFRVVNGSPVQLLIEKPGGMDHLALSGIELGASGSLGDPPVIEVPPPPPPIDAIFPDGLKIDFSRNDEFPLQEGWEPFFGDGTEAISEVFDFQGNSVAVTIEGNTHWRDYRPATGPFEPLADLLSDGPLCNEACVMSVTLDDLSDGAYELMAVFHTTQFGEQDGRPFTPFEIRVNDGTGNEVVVAEEKRMSDDWSADLSYEVIPFTVSGGRSVEFLFEKFEGEDHMALPALVLSRAGAQGDFDGSGTLDAADIDLLSQDVQARLDTPTFDLNGDGSVNDADRIAWIKDLRNTWVGDADLDGEFNSGDFVAVFQAGKFEQEVTAGWAEGDWNGDGRFSSGDFVVAFQDGGFEQGPRQAVAAVPEPGGLVLFLFGSFALMMRRNRTFRL